MQENTRIRIYYSRWSVVMSIAVWLTKVFERYLIRKIFILMFGWNITELYTEDYFFSEENIEKFEEEKLIL